MRILVRLGLLTVAFSLVTLASPAFGGIDQEGRVSGSHEVDGSYARLAGNGFSARVGQCVIYSVNSADWTVQRMVQSGVVRCNGINLASPACPGGTAFVETAVGSTYTCTAGHTFTNNTEYDATTYRTSSSGTTFHGHVNGADGDLGGMGLSHDIRAYAWGEATGTTSTCPSPSKGTFTLWKRYDTSSGWAFVTSSSEHNNNVGMSSTCWPSISPVTAGTFDVD